MFCFSLFLIGGVGVVECAQLAMKLKAGLEFFRPFPMETKYVKPPKISHFSKPEPQEPFNNVWMKTKGELHTNDFFLHACALAYMSGMLRSTWYSFLFMLFFLFLLCS